MIRRTGAEIVLIVLAFLAGLAAAAIVEFWECEQQAAGWLEEGR